MKMEKNCTHTNYIKSLEKQNVIILSKVTLLFGSTIGNKFSDEIWIFY